MFSDIGLMDIPFPLRVDWFVGLWWCGGVVVWWCGGVHRLARKMGRQPEQSSVRETGPGEFYWENPLIRLSGTTDICE